jgi:hypothetical protein
MSGNVWKRLGGIIELPRIIILDIRCVSFCWRLPDVSGRHVRMGSWRSLERWFPTDHDQNWSNVGRQPWKLRTTESVNNLFNHVAYTWIYEVKEFEDMGRTSFTQWEDMRRIWSRLIWKIWISCSSLPNWGWLEFRRGETWQIWEQRQQREWWCSLGPDMLHKTLPQRKSPKIELTENQWLHPKSRHARRPFCHQDLIDLIATPGTAHNNGRRYQLVGQFLDSYVCFFWFSEACFKQHLGPHFE